MDLIRFWIYWCATMYKQPIHVTVIQKPIQFDCHEKNRRVFVVKFVFLVFLGFISFDITRFEDCWNNPAMKDADVLFSWHENIRKWVFARFTGFRFSREWFSICSKVIVLIIALICETWSINKNKARGYGAYLSYIIIIFFHLPWF